MKAIQLFFELLTQYQQVKAQLIMMIEKHKAEVRLHYEEKMKQINRRIIQDIVQKPKCTDKSGQ